MVVEDVPILQEALRPTPDDVEMLRLVRVGAVLEDVYDPQEEREGEEAGQEAAFAGRELDPLQARS